MSNFNDKIEINASTSVIVYGPVTRAYFSTYNSTYEQIFKHVKVVIYKFCIRSKYARIRFDNVSYGEAARGVLSAQNFPTYESV